MIKKEQAIQSTFSNLLTSGFLMLIGIVTGIIVTRSLGPELKGQYMTLTLIVTLYGPFLVFGYQGGILYYGIRKQINLQQFFWTGWFVTLTIGTILFFMMLPAVKAGYLGAIAKQSNDFELILALTSLPLILLNAYAERVIRSYHLFHASNLRTIIGGVITLFYYLVLLFFSEIDLKQALYGFLLGQTIQLLMNLFFVIKYIKVEWKIDFVNIFKPWRYGIKAWLTNMLNQSNEKLDQVILTFLLNSSSFGIYTVGVGLSNLLTNIPSSYVNVFYNQIATREPAEALVLYAKAQRITFLVTLMMAFLLSLVAYPTIYLLYGEAFLPAALVVILYTPGLIFQVAARLSIKFYAAQGRPLKNSLVYIAGLTASLPFYFLLIPRYGINGAAIASSVTYMSAFLFSFYQINREYGLRLAEVLRFQKDDIGFIRIQISQIPIVKKYLKN